jgi:prepilin-type processing-associated H-X9-DG protein
MARNPVTNGTKPSRPKISARVPSGLPADRAVNVLFFDGHVEALQGAAAQAVLTLAPGVAPTTASASRPAAQPATVGTGQ